MSDQVVGLSGLVAHFTLDVNENAFGVKQLTYSKKRTWRPISKGFAEVVQGPGVYRQLGAQRP